MAFTLFTSLTEADKTQAIERLIKESTPRDDFFLLIILSILMASFGLIQNDTAVVIGSMLIAPLLSPVLSIALGIALLDWHLIGRSFVTLLAAVALGFIAAFILGFFLYGRFPELTPEILSRATPNLLSVLIALVAGFAAAFTLVKPDLSATLPGIAISVSLIPPLAVAGIGLSRWNLEIASRSFALFLINVAAIILSGCTVFFLTRMKHERTTADKIMKKEDTDLEHEEEKAEKEQEKKSLWHYLPFVR